MKTELYSSYFTSDEKILNINIAQVKQAIDLLGISNADFTTFDPTYADNIENNGDEIVGYDGVSPLLILQLIRAYNKIIE